MQKKSCSFQRLTEVELKHDLSQKKKMLSKWLLNSSALQLNDTMITVLLFYRTLANIYASDTLDLMTLSL